MPKEKNDIFPAETETCRAGEVRLTQEEWNSVADFVLRLADLVECEILGEAAGHKERKEAIANMHRMMSLAAGAVLYVGCNAADRCVFSVHDAKEQEENKNEADD